MPSYSSTLSTSSLLQVEYNPLLRLTSLAQWLLSYSSSLSTSSQLQVEYKRSVGWPLLRAEGFFCNLYVLYGGLGIGNLQFLKKKKINSFYICNFFQFLASKALDPDPD
jgi:hypothetical protein